jgi:hypothetical protein
MLIWEYDRRDPTLHNDQDVRRYASEGNDYDPQDKNKLGIVLECP